MAKKMKLKLSDLKVQSFVTSLDEKAADGLKGGATIDGRLCSVFVCSATHCPDPCPDGHPPPTESPCNSIAGCYPDSQSPCSGIGTVCTCQGNCDASYPFCPSSPSPC